MEKQLPTSERGGAGPAVTFAAVAALACVLTGCGSTESPQPEPGTFRVGVLPDQSESELRRIHQPLVDYLSGATGLELELIVPASYTELVEDFTDRDLDLAWFGGLTFLRAEESARADPLVMRDVDLEFTTDFLVAGPASERSAEDFGGKILAFGPRLSTSGHLMPRYFLRDLGIDAATFFGELRHSAGHDQTALWVRDGDVDIGAVNSSVADSMFGNGQLTTDSVRVLWTTPPYRNYVWAVQPDMIAGVRARLLNAFLALENRTPEHAAILAAHGARGYVPASREDYGELRRAVESVGEALGMETMQ